MSTTLQQWRSAIGLFGGGNGPNKESLSLSSSSQQHYLIYFVIISMILVYSNIMAMLLLIAGIESNPGPIHNDQLGW